MIWTCKRWVRWLGPYSENALPEKQAARVAAHLAACPACRAELAMLRGAARLLRVHKPSVPEPSADLWTRIHAEIAPVRPAAPRSLAWVVPATALAALVLFVIARPGMRRNAMPGGQTAAVPAPSAKRNPKVARSPLAPAFRSDPFAPLVSGRTPGTNAAGGPRTEIASVSSVRPRTRASKKAWVRSRAMVAMNARRPSSTLPFDSNRAKTVNRVAADGLAAGAKIAKANFEGEGGAFAFGAEGMPSEDTTERAASPQPVTASAVADGMPPMPHVSAADSAVDEALDAQRRGALFRYSQFSQR